MSRAQFQFEPANELTRSGDRLNRAVKILQDAGFKGVEFFWPIGTEKYPEAYVHFQGNRMEGFRALVVLMEQGVAVGQLSRVWPIEDGEPMGPHWLITFPEAQARERTTTAEDQA